MLSVSEKETWTAYKGQQKKQQCRHKIKVNMKEAKTNHGTNSKKQQFNKSADIDEHADYSIITTINNY